MSFSRNLTLIRKSNNLSQEELAYIIGVSRQTIYTWEADIASPNVLMLKKLAKALNVTIDELINGKNIELLPKKLNDYSLEYISEHDPIRVAGILNWFIKLEIGNEICFGLYDAGIKDYSYRLTVLNEIIIHDKKGYEILVEEFNNDMIKENCYSLVASMNNDTMQFIAKIENVSGIKKIQTFKDAEFLNDWKEETTIYFDNAKNYILRYGDKKYNTIQISYFDSESIYIECYLDENLETLLWRRFDKDRPSKEVRNLNGSSYGFFYETITDRLR